MVTTPSECTTPDLPRHPSDDADRDAQSDHDERPDGDRENALAGLKNYQTEDSGYARQQGTRPQTLGYGLADSPAGQAAWIVEKYQAWMDCDGHPENVLTRDELLDQVMLYWLPNSATSSARLYWESFARSTVTPSRSPLA